MSSKQDVIRGCPTLGENFTTNPIRMSAVREAVSDEEISRCFRVMLQLRPHLVEATFVPIVRQQEAGGYRLAFLDNVEGVCAVAGFRVLDNLAGGRILYVDDLVTDAGARSHGYGKRMLQWLAERAREEGCSFLELDSGVQRFDAHRFYLTNRMIISSHHFRLAL